MNSLTHTVTIDDDEGRIEIGCLMCRIDVRARYDFAMPVRMYVAAFVCDECYGEIVAFDAHSHQIMPIKDGSCVMCGSPEAKRTHDEYNGESEPVCADCRRKFRLQADQGYADRQAEWADRMAVVFGEPEQDRL